MPTNRRGKKCRWRLHTAQVGRVLKGVTWTNCCDMQWDFVGRFFEVRMTFDFAPTSLSNLLIRSSISHGGQDLSSSICRFSLLRALHGPTCNTGTEKRSR
jgi:hypothetical protein